MFLHLSLHFFLCFSSHFSNFHLKIPNMSLDKFLMILFLPMLSESFSKHFSFQIFMKHYWFVSVGFALYNLTKLTAFRVVQIPGDFLWLQCCHLETGKISTFKDAQCEAAGMRCGAGIQTRLSQQRLICQAKCFLSLSVIYYLVSIIASLLWCCILFF